MSGKDELQPKVQATEEGASMRKLPERALQPSRIDENNLPGDNRVEEAWTQPPRPVGASEPPFRQLTNSPHSSLRGATSKDRLRQFCRQVLRSPASPPPSPQSQESPQVAIADYTKPKFSESRTCKAGSNYRVLQSTPNASPGLRASPAAMGSHETGGTTGSADTSTSSVGHCSSMPVVPDMFSPDFDKYRELLHQDLAEYYRRDSARSPITSVCGSSGDVSPVFTPPHAAPLLASNGMPDVRQIVAVPLPDSPAHYTDSPKQPECNQTEFQLPASVTWKRRQHGWRRSSATPPEASPSVHTGRSEVSPVAGDKKSSDEEDGSGSDIGHGRSPGVPASGFRTPDVDNYCRRIRAEMAKLYDISPWPSPSESVESVGADVAKHRGTSPQLSPADPIKAAAPVEVRDSTTMSPQFSSPPPLLTRARASPVVRFAHRHRLSTVMEVSEETTCSSVHNTTSLAQGPLLEESLLMDAKQPALVDATFGGLTATKASQLDVMWEELHDDAMSDSLASFVEHERMFLAEFD